MKILKYFLFSLAIFTFNDLSSQRLYKIINNENRFGFINNYGDTIIHPKYKSVGDFSEGYAPVLIENKWGYINLSGSIKITPKFDSAYSFHDDIALVFIGSKCGYINKSGNFVINPKYADGRSFSEGIGCVLINNKWNYINKKEKIIINDFEMIESECGDNFCIIIPEFKSGLLKYSRSKDYSIFYDKNGKKHKFNKNVIYSFSENYIMYNDSNLIGYIDNNNEIVIKASYINGTCFINGNAWVIDKINNSFFLLNIDKNNNILFSTSINYSENSILINIGNNTCLVSSYNLDCYYNNGGKKLFIPNKEKNKTFANNYYLYNTRNAFRINNELFIVNRNDSIMYINIDNEIIWKKHCAATASIPSRGAK